MTRRSFLLAAPVAFLPPKTSPDTEIANAARALLRERPMLGTWPEPTRAQYKASGVPDLFAGALRAWRTERRLRRAMV